MVVIAGSQMQEFCMQKKYSISLSVTGLWEIFILCEQLYNPALSTLSTLSQRLQKFNNKNFACVHS